MPSNMDVLKRSIDKFSRARTQQQKEKWTRAHFRRYAMGQEKVSLGKFRMALFEMDLGHSFANQMFEELTKGNSEQLDIEEIILAVFGEPALPDNFGIASRYLSSSDNPGNEPKPDRKAQQIRQFWDLVGNRAVQKKQYKSVRDVILAMDKDGDGTLSRQEARAFFSKFFATTHAQVDEWFELLDTNDNGDLDLKDFGRQLEPYFQKNFGNPAEEITEWVARKKEDPLVVRQREIQSLWRLIGERAQVKGFASVRRLLHTLDQDDSGAVDREEIRLWFDRYLNLTPDKADRFFDLLDFHNVGELQVAEMRRHLAPYFQKTFMEESQVGKDYTFHTEEDLDIVNQRKIKAMFDEIGSRAFQKGFKNERQLMLAMDKDDTGSLDRQETRDFFRTYLGYYTNEKADKFFDLVDTDGSGEIGTQQVRRYLAPYFTNEFNHPINDLDRWSEKSESKQSGGSRSDRMASNTPAENKRLEYRRGTAAYEFFSQRPPANADDKPPVPEQEDEFSSMIITKFSKSLAKGGGGPAGLQQALRAQGSPAVTAGDLHMSLKRLGMSMKQREVNMLFDAIDTEGRGELSENEILQAVGGVR